MEKMLREFTFGKSLLVGAGILAVYYFGLYNDGSSIQLSIDTVTVNIQKSNKELESIKKAEEDAARYEATMKILGDDMAKVVKAIPENLSSFELLKTVSIEASNLGMEIVKLTPSQSFRSGGTQEPNTNFYEPVDVEVELAGTYPQIMLFLSNLTKLDKIVTTSVLNLSPKQNTNNLKQNPNPILTCAAKLTAYRYVAPKEAPGTPKPPGTAE